MSLLHFASLKVRRQLTEFEASSALKDVLIEALAERTELQNQFYQECISIVTREIEESGESRRNASLQLELRSSNERVEQLTKAIGALREKYNLETARMEKASEQQEIAMKQEIELWKGRSDRLQHHVSMLKRLLASAKEDGSPHKPSEHLLICASSPKASDVFQIQKLASPQRGSSAEKEKDEAVRLWRAVCRENERLRRQLQLCEEGGDSTNFHADSPSTGALPAEEWGTSPWRHIASDSDAGIIASRSSSVIDGIAAKSNQFRVCESWGFVWDNRVLRWKKRYLVLDLTGALYTFGSTEADAAASLLALGESIAEIERETGEIRPPSSELSPNVLAIQTRSDHAPKGSTPIYICLLSRRDGTQWLQALRSWKRPTNTDLKPK